MRCRMLPVSDDANADERGRRHYACANAPCDARAFTAHPPERVYGYGSNCQGGGLRLGDRIEWALNWIGITKQRWAKLHGSDDCTPCSERQERLNQMTRLNRVTTRLNVASNPRLWLRTLFAVIATIFRWLP